MRRSFSLPAILLLVTCTQALSQQVTLMGFSAADSRQQLQWEAAFDAQLDSAHVGSLIRDMSAFPHAIGSEGSRLVATYVLRYFTSLGFDAYIDTLYSLFSTPRQRVLELKGDNRYKASLMEPPLKEDATSGQTKEQLPPYNCWSADGDVTAPLIFVNYGLPEDYEKLEQLGIDVKGKIVIAKYGRSWRGIKPKVAQEHGAIGCLIYSDPADDGYAAGDVYPKGPFKNEYGVQRGSVMDMPIYPGDPLSPGVGHTKNKFTDDRSQASNLLSIPVLPISYHDAQPLLASLEGPVVPSGWQGSLPLTYHVGPGKNEVHLKLAFDWSIKPLYNVIAKIKGEKFPNEWVIRGNHHDAWVNGAADPISGLAAEMEEARSVASLLKQGWKPARTILYCAWDGEEPGLLGSTEWTEYHARELQEKAVIYINTDGNGRGFLGAAGSRALAPFINQVAEDVTDPETGVSVLERSRSRSLINAENTAARKKILQMEGIDLAALGSGSDYSPFFQHLGIPSLNLDYGGEDRGGEYHSIYDSYDNYRRFKDPGFRYGVTLAKTTGRITLRMANADRLPFDYTKLAAVLETYTTEVMQLLESMRASTNMENQLIRDNRYVLAADPLKTYYPPAAKEPVPFLDFAELQNALVHVDKAARTMSGLSDRKDLNAEQVSILNQVLYHAEQELLLTNGLPRRPWYKHAIYAPGFYTGYGVKTLPGIREAVEQRKWKEAQEEIHRTAMAISRFADYLENAAAKY